MLKRLFAVTAVVSTIACPAWAGFHYIAVTSADGEGGEMASMSVEAWIDGPRAKIVFTDSGNPMMPVGSYILTQDGGETLYLVNPEEGTYSEWDLEGMLESLGGMMESMGGFMNMEVSDPVVEKLLEEDGGRILGYPTTHHRYRTAYTMEMKVMGMKRGDHYENVQDIWSTTAIDDEAFGVWLRNVPKSTGFDAFDKLAKAEFSKVNGFPLKTVTESTTSGVKKSGRATTSTTTMEVTLLEETAVRDSTFVLDPELEEVPFMPFAGAMPTEAQGEQPEGEEEEKGGMFKSFKKKIKG
jgi:hypothetical protein